MAAHRQSWRTARILMLVVALSFRLQTRQLAQAIESPTETTAPQANQPLDPANLDNAIFNRAMILDAINTLDADRFSERERAERTLRAMGLMAVPELELAASSELPEVRLRAQRISTAIQHSVLLAEFTTLAERKPDRIDLEHGFWLIARIENPLLPRSAIPQKLDELADRFRRKLPAGQRATDLPAREAVERLSRFLFKEEGFAVNLADYNSPSNSALDRVLESRRGLPITLSHVMIAVGRRVGLPLVGLMIPRRYMLKYEPPPGHAEDEMVIDPFERGKIYTVDELEDVIAGLGSGFDPARHLNPATPTETITRMLRNLASAYRETGRPTVADRVDDYRRMYEPED